MPTNNQAAKSYIDAVMARADAATEGPLRPEYDDDEKCFLVMSPCESIVAQVYDCYGFQGCSDEGTARSNAHLFAASRQDIPALGKMLLRAIEALESIDDEDMRCCDVSMSEKIAHAALADLDALAKGSQ